MLFVYTLLLVVIAGAIKFVIHYGKLKRDAFYNSIETTEGKRKERYWAYREYEFGIYQKVSFTVAALGILAMITIPIFFF